MAKHARHDEPQRRKPVPRSSPRMGRVDPAGLRPRPTVEPLATRAPMPFPIALNALDLASVLIAQLDRLGLAMFVLGDDDEILAANCAARRLCERQDAFCEFGGRLWLLRRSDAERWRNARCSPGGVSLLNMPRATGRRSYLLLLSRLSLPSSAAQTVTCLTVLDPHCDGEATLEALLGSSLGLSQSEARVVASLAAGHSVRDAAARLGLSHHTVRSHLKRIFTRCEVHSQAELMQLVGRIAQFGCPSITPDEGVGITNAWREHPGRYRAQMREKE